MYAVKLDGGAVVFRLDPAPVAGEQITEYRELSAPVGPFERYDWAADAVVPLDAPEVEAALLRLVDDRRDKMFAALLDKNDARSVEYLNKAMEAYSDTGPWPYLSARAAVLGTTVEDERLAVMTARDNAEADRVAFTQIVAGGQAAIRVAETAADKIAAYDTIPWPEGN